MKAYAAITEKLLQHIEQKQSLPWSKPWSIEHTMPYNGLTGHKFSGTNLIFLWFSQMIHGYRTPVWLTVTQLRQWCEKNGRTEWRDSKYGDQSKYMHFLANVKKGETSSIVLRPMFKKEADPQTGEDKIAYTWFKAYHVFNLDQLEGAIDYKDFVKDVKPEAKPIEAFETVFNSMPDKPVVKNGSVAAYVPSLDFIEMPPITTFADTVDYYWVLAHEAIHSTGHKSRLNRAGVAERGEYSYEELVAEIGAAFLMWRSGIEMPEEKLQRSASYINTWAERLKENKDWYPKACSDAARAVSYILGEGTSNESESSDDEDEEDAA